LRRAISAHALRKFQQAMLSESVVVGEPDEDAVHKLRDLDDEKGKLVSVIVSCTVEWGEGVDHARDVGIGRDDISDGDAVHDSVEDLGALPGRVDGDRAADDAALAVAFLGR
jgi:hypothetical protein